MTKYIDADKLKAHIQYLIKKDNYELFDVPELLSFIDSLQQEQLDIGKIKREWYNNGYLEGRKNAHIPARELGLPKSWDFQQEQPEMDLEKEIERWWGEKYMKNYEGLPILPVVQGIARHFAEWQSKQDKETIELAEDHAFLAGADWQKEQMMKEAAEGQVRKDGTIGYIEFSNERQFHSLLEQFQDCDKVRIIIVKGGCEK